MDSGGDIYVVDRPNNRVQKFDSEGHFLRMWGKEVNSGTSGNPDLCTDAGPPTDVCGKGAQGTANGQFGAWTVLGSYIAVGPGDAIWVGDVGRIQRFDSAGAYQGQITLGAGEKVKSLAVDSKGDVYAAIEGKEDVRKWNSSGIEQTSVTVKEPLAIATGPAEELYVVSGASSPKVVGFDSSGAKLFEDVDNLGEAALDKSTGIAVNPVGTIYVSNLNPPTAISAPTAPNRANTANRRNWRPRSSPSTPPRSTPPAPP